MKILYGIQTTGSGHLVRSTEIIEELKRYADIDIILSGPKPLMKVPFEVKYRKKCLHAAFDMQGGVSIFNTVWGTLKEADLARLIQDISTIDVSPYDVIVSDFDPISAWAARISGKRSVGISHQLSFTSSALAKLIDIAPFYDSILKFYAGCTENLGINYFSKDSNMYTPIIRGDLHDAHITDDGHITVYLALHATDILVEVFKNFPDVEWHVFAKDKVSVDVPKNVKIFPLNKEGFSEDLLSSSAVLCSAGFTLTSECLYLGKKLLTVGIKNHYEQQLNSEMLAIVGVKSIASIDELSDEIDDWLKNWPTVKMDYPNVIPEIVKRILG